MFEELERINTRPEPFEFYTAADLWTDEYIAKQMLSFHLNGEVDAASRNTTFIERSVEWIVGHFSVRSGTRIADFGCGPGLYTTRLAERQADVTGIDFSQNSLQYAREVAAGKELSIKYVQQNYLEFKTEERFDLILMIMCDFTVLSPAQRREMLSKFHAILEPGGSVLLDVYSPVTFEQREEVAVYEAGLLNGFWSPDKYYGFLNTFKYSREKLILDKYTIVEADRIRNIYNWLQCFTPEDIKREFAECWLAVEELYSDVAGTPYDPNATEFAIVAKRL